MSIRLDFKNFTYDNLLNLIPKIYSLNSGLENRVKEVFNQRREVNGTINEIIKLLSSPQLGNKRSAVIGSSISPTIISTDVKKLKTMVLNAKNSSFTSSNNFNKDNENKVVLLTEENEYIKGKLENMQMQFNSMKQMLDDSEEKRINLMQNFKELEKHAQLLNTENQNLKMEKNE